MKEKICKRCEKPKRIWARGLCQSCDIVENPVKYKLEKTRVATKKKKAEKAESVTTLKKKLDAIFSLYIRTKHSKNGLVECYTCGVQKPISQMQNGHFFSRSNLSTRFLEINCRPQCAGCNVFKHGNYIVYTQKMMQELGAERFNKLEQLSKQAHSIPKQEYEVMLAVYKEELEKLQMYK